MESWKIIDGFPDYLISSNGRVKTLERKIRYTHHLTGNEHFRTSIERLLKCYYNVRTGYKFVQLRNGLGVKNKNIHRLVADNFLPKEPSKAYVNHIDGNKHNNTVENLEWCTNEYNHKHATETGLKAKGEQVSSAKLNARMVHAIKYFLNKGVSHAELSTAFMVSRSNISMIAEGKQWKHIALTGEELTLKEVAK